MASPDLAPTLQSFESAYIQQQGVKCNNFIMSGPPCLLLFMQKVNKQIKLEKRHAQDLRLPRHKRNIRHAREMELVGAYCELIEKLQMSLEENRAVVRVYLIGSSWLKGSLITFMQATESRLAKNKSKMLLRVDPLTAVALDELLERPDGHYDEVSNELIWKLHTMAKNLVGKGTPPDPKYMMIEDTDSLFVMITKLQLTELYYARGMSCAYIKASSIGNGLASTLKPLVVLRGGARSSMETLAIVRSGLKALKSVLGCYGGDHVMTLEQRKVFNHPHLMEELEFWLHVVVDVRHGGDFLTARRVHRNGDKPFDEGGFGDDGSSVASGNTISGEENNANFRRVVDLIGNGLVYDLLWCVNAVVSIVIQSTVDERLASAEAKKAAEILAKEQAKKAARSQRQPSTRMDIQHFRPVLAPEKDSKAIQDSKADGTADNEDSNARSIEDRVLSAMHLCQTSLKLGVVVISRFAFMQHASERGNPALGNVPLVRAADEEAVAALDCAATLFSLGRIDRDAIAILDAGLSLCYSRGHSIAIAISTLQCVSKAAMCLFQAGTGTDEPINSEWLASVGLTSSENAVESAGPASSNVMKVVYQEPDRHTLKGRLTHLLAASVLKVMHIMHLYNMSLSVQHQGLMCIRLIAREVFMKRDDIDALIGASEEDDFVEDDEGFLAEDSIDASSAVGTSSQDDGGGKSLAANRRTTAFRSGDQSRASTAGGHGDEHSLSDMNSTISASSHTLYSTSDEPSPLIDNPSVPVSQIAHEWLAVAYEETFSESARYLSLKSGNNKGVAKARPVVPPVTQTQHKGQWVGIAELLRHIADSHAGCIEVMEQMLLLVYHLGKSSYAVKIALMEAGFEVIINQIATTTAHNYYMTALCFLGIEALQMDQIVL